MKSLLEPTAKCGGFRFVEGKVLTIGEKDDIIFAIVERVEARC